MANPKIQPRLSEIMHRYLDDLVEIGAFGSSPHDVARALIEAGIRDALSKNLIAVRKVEGKTTGNRTKAGKDH
jgi:Arc/MetJ-type ribon-helix-helix transcriptional regulator